MQGIPFAEFERLLISLGNLKNSELYNLTEDQKKKVLENEEQLKQIYQNYQLSLKQVSDKVRQFGTQKLMVRKLVKENRQHLKSKKQLPVPSSLNVL